MRVLLLDRTGFDDQALASLAGLENLEELDLEHNQIAGPGLMYLSGLTNLRILNLNFNCDDADEDLDLTTHGKHLRPLTKLEDLDVGFSRLDDAGLAHLEGMTSLRTLKINSTQVRAGLEAPCRREAA